MHPETKIKLRKNYEVLIRSLPSCQSCCSGCFRACSQHREAFGDSDLLLDERVLQSLVDADALGRVQHQGAVQQVLQLHHLLPLVLRQPLAPDHVGQQVFGGVHGAHHRHLFLGTQQDADVTLRSKKK